MLIGATRNAAANFDGADNRPTTVAAQHAVHCAQHSSEPMHNERCRRCCRRLRTAAAAAVDDRRAALAFVGPVEFDDESGRMAGANARASAALLEQDR